MWTVEHSIDTRSEPEAIWRAWVNVERWPEWNADIEQIELRGPFGVGSTIAMTPHGQETIELRVAAVVKGEQFVDEAEVAGTVIRTTHRVDPLPDGDGARIVYRLEASGPEAEEIGPAVSADFPETLAALAEHVTRLTAPASR